MFLVELWLFGTILFTLPLGGGATGGPTAGPTEERMAEAKAGLVGLMVKAVAVAATVAPIPRGNRM